MLSAVNCQVSYSLDSQASFTDFLLELGFFEDDKRVRPFLCRKLTRAFDCGSKLFANLGNDRYNLKSVIRTLRKTAQFPERSLRHGRINHRRRRCCFVCCAANK